MSINIARILESNAEKHPEKIAIIHGDQQITYGALLHNVRRRGAWFAEHGIGKGDGVLIVVPMSIPLYEILIALFHIGAVAVFVDAWADRKRLELARGAFAIKAFIGVGKAHLLRLLSPSLRSIPVKLKAKLPGGWSQTVGEPVSVLPDDPALITFTTGSTGAPKGANRTHGFLLAQHRTLERHLNPTPQDIDMATLPIFPLSNLAVGGTTLLPDIDFRNVADFDPPSVFRQMSEHGITTSAGSPAFFTPLAEYLLRNHLSLHRFRHLFVGGAPIFPHTAQLLRTAFPNTQITILYGSTEAEPISSIEAEELIEEAMRKEGIGLPVGVPVDSIRLRILPRGEEQQEEGMNAPGEICVTGEHVLKSYVGDPEGWKEKFIALDGEMWLRTGDAGRLGADGSLFLLGRARNSWVRNGRRIFTLPVEMILERIDGVRIGTVLNIQGKTVVFAETTETEKEIEERIRATLSAHGIECDSVVQLRRIPRDPRHASKINYEELAARGSEQ